MKFICTQYISYTGPGTPVPNPAIAVRPVEPGDMCFAPKYGEVIIGGVLLAIALIFVSYFVRRSRASDVHSALGRGQHDIFVWTLFWTFWAVYLLSALGTLGMLFFDFGKVLDGERSTLINAFLIETSVAIGALFYSFFKLRP